MKAILFIIAMCTTMFAQNIIVGVSEFEPNIMYKGETIIGYDIDMWTEISNRANIEFEFKKYNQFDKLISDISNNKLDVAMSGITITSAREKEFDFSYPYMRSNLAVMTHDDGIDVFGVLFLFIKESWGALAIFAVYLILFSTLIYFAEYGKESFSDKFWVGIFDGMYFVNTTTTSTGYGDKTPMTWLGKFISMIIMWVGIGIIFPYITGQMSNIITTYNNTDKVMDFSDLVGKKKVVVANTTSEDLMITENMKYESMPNIDRCLRLLENGEIDMVVYDESLLRYVDKVNQYKIQPLRPIIQNYGFALSSNHELKNRIDIAILEIIEDGTYQVLYDRWFKN